MLRTVALGFWLAGAGVVSIVTAGVALAQEKFEFSVPGPAADESGEARWLVCKTWDRDRSVDYVSSIVSGTKGEIDNFPRGSFETFVKQHYDVSANLWSFCNVEESAGNADARRTDYVSRDPNHPAGLVEVEWTKADAKGSAKSGEAKGGGGKKKPAEAVANAEDPASDRPTAPPKKSAAQIAAEEAAARRAQREAEFQAKQAEYERQLADRERRVQEFNELQAKMEAQKEANRLAAEAAVADYQAKMAAHSQTVAQHDADQARYEQQIGAAGSASTDEDANRCVTAAEVTQNASFKGNTAASVTNGCGKPVDLRICLMTGKEWNCGVQWGVAPQAKWSFSSFNATGELFVDARTSGSSRPLANPQ